MALSITTIPNNSNSDVVSVQTHISPVFVAEVALESALHILTILLVVRTPSRIVSENHDVLNRYAKCW